ncbi:MAG: hypothetical protein ABIH39_03760 [Candidatus Margulisiibacteriota bacterium]
MRLKAKVIKYTENNSPVSSPSFLDTVISWRHRGLQGPYLPTWVGYNPQADNTLNELNIRYLFKHGLLR